MDFTSIEKQAIAIIKKHGIEAGEEILMVCLFPLIEQVVKETKTPVDDVLLATLEPSAKKAISDLIAKAKAA